MSAARLGARPADPVQVILVDTNVVSEPLKPRRDPRVVAWLHRQRAETLFISTITAAEILSASAGFRSASGAAGWRGRSRAKSAACSPAAYYPSISRLVSFGDFIDSMERSDSHPAMRRTVVVPRSPPPPKTAGGRRWVS